DGRGTCCPPGCRRGSAHGAPLLFAAYAGGEGSRHRAARCAGRQETCRYSGEEDRAQPEERACPEEGRCGERCCSEEGRRGQHYASQSCAPEGAEDGTHADPRPS